MPPPITGECKSRSQMKSAFAFVGAAPMIDPSDADVGLFLPVIWLPIVVAGGSKKVGDDALRNFSLSFAAVPSSGS